MNRLKFERMLNRAEHEERPHFAMSDAWELRASVTAPWVDATLEKRTRALCERHGLDCEPVSRPQLAIGETWLLLAGTCGRGDVVRLVATREKAAADANLDLDEAHRATQGLHTAAASAARRLPTASAALRLAILGGPPRMEILGSSLGLSVVIAKLSAVLDRPALSNVAGTAVIDSNGHLRPVTHLAEKVHALLLKWPHVDTLVIADTQPDADVAAGSLKIVRKTDVGGAIQAYGLSLANLPECHLEQRETALAKFKEENQRSHPATRWQELSNEAWETAQALKHEPTCHDQANEALLYAALFASHGGRGQVAQELLANIDESDLHAHPGLLVQKLIYQGASAIDSNIDKAHGFALRAVELCESLPDEQRRSLRGQAHGTLGRVHMHGGDNDKAEAFLREGLAHHRKYALREWPRSAFYLATCLRRLKRADEALLQLQEALSHAQTSGRWALAETTTLYLSLELGRTLLALGRLDDAVHHLDSVVAHQPTASSYPRLGAHRTLAEVLLRMERRSEAQEHLRICVAAAAADEGMTLRRVGAVAAGEALLAKSDLMPTAELQAVWRACFPAEADPAQVVHQWVY